MTDINLTAPVALEGADIDRVDGVAGPASGIPFLIAKAVEETPGADALIADAVAETTPVAKDDGLMHDPSDASAPREIGEAPVEANAVEAAAVEAVIPVPETVDAPVEPAAEVVEAPEAPEAPVSDAAPAADEAPAAEETPETIEAATEPETAPETPVLETADGEPTGSSTPVEAPAVEPEPEVEVETPAAETVEEPEAPAAEAPVEPVAKAADTEQDRLRRYLTTGTTIPKAEPVAKDVQSNAAAAAEAPVPGGVEIVEPEIVIDGTPGTPEWEADDAQNAANAIALLLALRERVQAAAVRERAEYGADYEDNDALYAAWDLDDADCALDFVLGVLARFQVEESAAADVVAKAAGKPGLGDLVARFLPTPQETPVADATDTPADVAKAETPADVAPSVLEDIRKALEAVPTLDSVTKAVVESPALSDVLKSVVTEAVKGAVAEEVTPLREDLAKAAERIATMESQPMPGGPLLRGSQGLNSDGLTLVVKDGQSSVGGGQQIPTAPEEIAKALESVTDPGQRDVLSRALASAQHPLSR